MGAMCCLSEEVGRKGCAQVVGDLCTARGPLNSEPYHWVAREGVISKCNAARLGDATHYKPRHTM